MAAIPLAIPAPATPPATPMLLNVVEPPAVPLLAPAAPPVPAVPIEYEIDAPGVTVASYSAQVPVPPEAPDAVAAAQPPPPPPPPTSAQRMRVTPLGTAHDVPLVRNTKPVEKGGTVVDGNGCGPGAPVCATAAPLKSSAAKSDLAKMRITISPR
jgi:hypothetical protein